MIAAALLLPAIAGALLLTYSWDRTGSLGARAAVAVPLATALQGLVGYACAASFGHASPGPVAVVAALLLAAVPRPAARAGSACCGPRRRRLPAGRARRRCAAGGGTLVVGVLYVLARRARCWPAVFDRAIVATPEGGIATGVDHNLGDLPFHLAIVNGFVRGENFPPEHPELAGVRLTYPFGVDLAAALCRRGGRDRCARRSSCQDLLLALSLRVPALALRAAPDGRRAGRAPDAAARAALSGGLGCALVPARPARARRTASSTC